MRLKFNPNSLSSKQILVVILLSSATIWSEFEYNLQHVGRFINCAKRIIQITHSGRALINIYIYIFSFRISFFINLIFFIIHGKKFLLKFKTFIISHYKFTTNLIHTFSFGINFLFTNRLFADNRLFLNPIYIYCFIFFVISNAIFWLSQANKTTNVWYYRKRGN